MTDNETEFDGDAEEVNDEPNQVDAFFNEMGGVVGEMLGQLFGSFQEQPGEAPGGQKNSPGGFFDGQEGVLAGNEQQEAVKKYLGALLAGLRTAPNLHIEFKSALRAYGAAGILDDDALELWVLRAEKVLADSGEME
jgi:hypothetical protein